MSNMRKEAHKIIDEFSADKLAFFLSEHLRCTECPEHGNCRKNSNVHCYEIILRMLHKEKVNSIVNENSNISAMAQLMAEEVMKGQR